MVNKGFFSIGDFAKFSRTTRDTLHHYDKIGLLSPLSRGNNNNYRYYSTEQLAIVNVIRTLQEFGMTLSEIATIKERRTPEFIYTLLEEQIKEIDNKIYEWNRARKLLFTLRQSIASASDINEDAIDIKFLPAEAIILGELNDYTKDKDDYDMLHVFYEFTAAKYPDIDFNYPVWAVYSEERVKHGDWTWPDRYYFYNPEGYDRKPAALYAIGYTRGGYGENDALYRRMIRYIDENGFEICGNAYEEYPLNEFCISDDANYLIRIMITVREKIK